MEIDTRHRYDIGVVVGRFQVPELHVAHKKVMEIVMKNHKQFIILIGITNGTLCTKQNPLNFIERKLMLQEAYPNAIISYIQDRPDDKEWSLSLDKHIQCLCPTGTVCLYGGRNSFATSYKGKFSTFELDEYTDYSGTEDREEIGKEPINSIDFRKGVIYATQNRYNLTYPCVDIAIIKDSGDNRKGLQVLMGRRTEASKWKFPGGFVDIADKTFEEAAIREAQEEIGMELDKDSIKYICSSNIKDERYNGQDEKIMSTFYKIDYLFGCYEPTDVEFFDVEWIDIDIEFLNDGNVNPSHEYFFTKLVNSFKRRKNDQNRPFRKFYSFK